MKMKQDDDELKGNLPLRQFMDRLHENHLDSYIQLPMIAVMVSTKKQWQYVFDEAASSLVNY